MENKPYVGAELIGPFNAGDYYSVRVEGHLLPHIKVRKGTGQNDGKLDVLLDDRLSFVMDDEPSIFLLVAHAMAVAAGYSCFGENSVKEPNIFKVKMIGLE